MWNMSPEKYYQMITHMADRHKGEMHSLYTDYKVIRVFHPKYDEAIEQIVPLLVIDFK